MSTTSNSVFSSTTAAAPPPTAHRHRHHRRRGGDAELVFVLLLELRQLEHGHVADEIEHLVDRGRHACDSPSGCPGVSSETSTAGSGSALGGCGHLLVLLCSPAPARPPSMAGSREGRVDRGQELRHRRDEACSAPAHSSTSRLGSVASTRDRLVVEQPPVHDRRLDARASRAPWRSRPGSWPAPSRSPALNTTPVGPFRCASSAVMPRALNARLSSVFLIDVELHLLLAALLAQQRELLDAHAAEVGEVDASHALGCARCVSSRISLLLGGRHRVLLVGSARP